MGLAREIRRRVRPALAPFLLACAIVYFGYHLVQGERGLIAWLRLSQQIEKVELEVAGALAERWRLEQRVELLRPRLIDRDMLDERARRVLGLAHADEIVVLDPE